MWKTHPEFSTFLFAGSGFRQGSLLRQSFPPFSHDPTAEGIGLSFHTDVLSSAGPPGSCAGQLTPPVSIRPAGQPRPAVISVLCIASSFYSASFSTFRWPAALSSGQRRWRFPPCGTLPTASFLPELSTVSFDITSI